MKNEFGYWSSCEGCAFRGYLANQGMIWCNIGCHPHICGYYTPAATIEEILTSEEGDWDDDEDPNPYKNR